MAKLPSTGVGVTRWNLLPAIAVPCLALLLLTLGGVGCSSYRLVLEPYDSRQALRETVVFTDDEAKERSGAKIALIGYEGLIALGEQASLLGSRRNPVSDFVEALEKARRDERVKGVVLYINSPGGTVTAADILYRELKRFKGKSGKPVVVLLGEVAASGGYYLACAGDEIIAHPTTITGSIGVIMQTVNVSAGLGKLGISARAITSGANKNMGSPLEPAQPAHWALFQQIVDDFHERFVGVVRENRPGLTTADLATATDGRVITGARAVKLGLVDSTGYLLDAFKQAKARANLAHARLVKYHRPGKYVATAYAGAAVAATPDKAGSATTADGANPIMNFNLLQFNAFDGNGLAGLLYPAGPTAYYLWVPEF